MKILILSGISPRHKYFVREIQNISNIETLTITHKRLHKKRLVKMIIKSPSTFFSRFTKYLIYYLSGQYKKEKLFFGSFNDFNYDQVDDLNSFESISIMQEYDPDLIVSFGIPIISKKIISLAKFGAINLHGGISPHYKGGNTIFWALYNNEPEMAGATIHYMEKKVDSGAIIAQIYPSIKKNDNEISISAKIFKTASKEMSSIVQWILKNKKQIKGIQQKEKGNLYLAKQRTVFIDLKGKLLIKKNLRDIYLKERIERYYL